MLPVKAHPGFIMVDQSNRYTIPNSLENNGKPRSIARSERALWIWVAWTCVWGAYETFHPAPASEQNGLSPLLDGLTIPPETLLAVSATGYALTAASIAWIAVKIGTGHSWARTTLMIGFVLQVFWVAGQSSYTLTDYLANVPDLILQCYALYLLYTRPGRDWFNATRRT